MQQDQLDRDPALNRRQFMQSVVATGAALSLSGQLWAQAAGGANDLNVAIIGAGSQGRVLIKDALKIPGVRFKAVADVWSYSQRYASGILRKFEQPVTVYEDYREMLAKERDLDAVLIATPDWVHAEQTIACLNAGLHVYCEKEMSNSLEDAKRMVEASRTSGKLLQIGHQRRSNPRYHHALKMIEKDRICGKITHFYGQWNRSRRLEVGWPEKFEMTAEQLKRFGYVDMYRFRNWRWFRKFSGGAMADLGSHQIDVFNWFLKAAPTSVMASGGAEYYKQTEWYDHVMAIYEYPGNELNVRGVYQVLNTTSYGDFYETIMGDEGTLVISEDTRKGFVMREPQASRREWEDNATLVEGMDKRAIELKIGESRKADAKEQESLEAEASKPPHQLHLENFFSAIRNGTPLSCPGEVGYETAVTVLKANEAIADGGRLAFDPPWFKV